ncbi:MAG TPA: DnaA regulatory inactivator Hda [Chromatiales bacterium]|nr:DnaA regulatory inactivator Hda [Chromatiales bacterium]
MAAYDPMSRQLPLGIRLRSTATLGNFIPSGNEEALACVKRVVAGQTRLGLYLWGGVGCGKSHLLQAACHALTEQGGTSAYIPLARAGEFNPGLLQGLETMCLVCIDDVDGIAGQEAWEMALFHLYNRVRENDNRMIFSANVSPGAIAVEMPDLKSRLSWGVTVRLAQPDDDLKILILQQWAKERGLHMPKDVAHYLLSRMSRDLHSLSAMLDALDRAALVAQRRLTIPFVRETVVTEDR